MTKKRIIIFGLLVLIFLAVGSYALAQPTGTEATLLVTNGDVTVIQPQNFFLFNNNQKINLTTGDIMLVVQGDMIEVSSASSAMLTMGDGTSADLFPNTVVELSELFADDINFRVRLSVLTGKVVNRVQRLLKADDAYEVRSPSSTASVRGTVFAVDVYSNQEMFVSVDEGVVAVQMGEQEVLVEAGFEVTAVTGQPLETQPQSIDSNATLSAEETAVKHEMIQAAAQPDLVVDSDSEADLIAESADDADDVQYDEADVADNHNDSVSTTEEENDDERDELLETAVPDITSTTSSTNPDQTAPPATATPMASGSTSVPPTATRLLPTNTAVPPTVISVPPTNTAVPSTATPIPPTNIAVPPTATSIPPTNTPVPPPPTNTPVPPPPVPTNTPEPPPPPTDEPKVTLCHKDTNTLTVDQSSVQAHLDHGDYLGACN